MNFIYDYLVKKNLESSYFDILLDISLSKESIDIINTSYEQFIDNFKLKNKFVYKTLRMTCLEFS